MTDSLAATSPFPAARSVGAASPCRRAFRAPKLWLVLWVLHFPALNTATLAAHETIDVERANALVAAAEAVTLTKKADGAGVEGETRFALGTRTANQRPFFSANRHSTISATRR